ncbi:Do family serine endopeptidase [Pleionea litopenaei]|uniref:Do family serine endopeptidase n=1 Tax=Pleionea litopenaei TaxID=3070815 RepID=A0AA51RTA6_9GAMM|nr:Do family serine endopeptidase [Pleionea sp. HL-JVS1]WMS87125.1 Do family serine endopeptidase [Pleionea sp. HL-JVS1]
MLNKQLLLTVCLYLGVSAAWASLPTQVNDQALPSLAPMLQKANPAVVNIATTATIETPYMRDPVFGYLIPPQRQRQANSLGSGVIIDAQMGLILTNHHVIRGADEIQISLEDGREFEAKLVGSDEKTDVALLSINADNLTAIPLGNSDALQVGDFVVAIGNPFSLGHSVTSGIVSAKGRSGLGIEEYEDFIQTDAAINPGNSGGALVNLRGELVGINTAILGPKGNIGIGFAIPINLAQTITQHLVDYGEVRRGILGVSVQELTPSLARALDVTKGNGVVVTEVVSGSSAADAGIQTTDIIVSVNGRKLKTAADLLNQEGLLPAGSRIELQILRDGKSSTVSLVLQEPELVVRKGETLHPLLDGIELTVQKGASSDQGVTVSQVERRSRAAYFGLRQGDRIVAVGRFRTGNLDQLAQILSKAGRALPLTVMRGKEQFLIVIR